MGCDGDDNYHIGLDNIINDVNMGKVEHYLKLANITIRSKTSTGYRITANPTDIDYLSHYYSPVYICNVWFVR